jgi:hypothetical protein
MQGLIIPNSALVEVNIATLETGPINFEKQTKLEKAMILGIEVCSASELAVSPNNKTVVSSTGLTSAVLVLKDGQKDTLYQYPLKGLQSSYNGGWIRLFPAFIVDWQKCYVEILSTTNLNVNESFIFNILYR